MKILKRNEEHAPEKWAVTCECGKCGSTLEVEEADCSSVTHMAGDQRDSYDETVAGFTCPVCQGLNLIQKVPPVVLARLKNGGRGATGYCMAQKVTRGPIKYAVQGWALRGELNEDPDRGSMESAKPAPARKVLVPCPSCGGDGYFEGPDDCCGSGDAHCSRCGGTGRVEGL